MHSSSRPTRRNSQRQYREQEISVPTRTSSRRVTSIVSNNNISHADAANSFPGKLYSLITHESTDLIQWLPHGRAFRINDPCRFASEIVPVYFKHTKLSSFQRQLNLYGFRRIIKGEEIGAYFHPYFIRDREDLVSEIRRIATKSLISDSMENSTDLSNNLTLGIANQYTDLTSYGIKIVTDVEQTKSIAIATAQMEKNTRARQVSKYPMSHHNLTANKHNNCSHEIDDKHIRNTQYSVQHNDLHQNIEKPFQHSSLQQHGQDSVEKDQSLDFQFIFPSLSIKPQSIESNQSVYIPSPKGKMSKLSMNIGFDKVLSLTENCKHRTNVQQLWKPDPSTKTDNAAPTPLMNPLMSRSLVHASALTQSLYKTYKNSNNNSTFVDIFDNQEIHHSGSQVVSQNDFIAIKSLNRRNQEIEVSSPKRTRLDIAGTDFFTCANAIIAKSTSFDQLSQPLFSRGQSFQSVSDDYYPSQYLSINQSFFKHNTSLGNLSQYNDDNPNMYEWTQNNETSALSTTNLGATAAESDFAMTQRAEISESEYLLMDIDDNSQIITDNDYSILLQTLYSQSGAGMARSYSTGSLVIDAQTEFIDY